MMHADDSRLQALRARAYALAESGRFNGAHAVEQALIAEGWPNAGAALQSSYTRKAISERCMAATKAH
ncbi:MULTISPECIES: hypothetical protein [Sphingobium]|uniref:Uncharacterized protein n=1 Tax=Sphingobium chungbukense TaxID=56193 RepID=A0A0M3AMD7_9SPHN|nr:MULTISPECIES: hypothetical protein [Sphingobium]KKW91010.1 hypothetical protein YP76_15475 [Sphingobium chungbukense]PJG49077.1 hypothetical protein CAF53_13220 [Sphingobium sp. LB126]